MSRELELMSRPALNSPTRVSIGLDQAVGEYYYINISQLEPFENQARKKFNNNEITKLANSILEYGVRQPLTVVKKASTKYEVISGERRLRAAKQAGLQKVPCIILKEGVDPNAIALIENIHREDLHPIELGLAYKGLIERGVFESQEKLSRSISVPKSTISEYIKLSNVPEEIRARVIEKNIISRDELRSLVKACEGQDVKKMRSSVGLIDRCKKNFSVVRITLSDGAIKVQNSGLSKLSKEDKQEVKRCLNRLIKQVDQS